MLNITRGLEIGGRRGIRGRRTHYAMKEGSLLEKSREWSSDLGEEGTGK